MAGNTGTTNTNNTDNPANDKLLHFREIYRLTVEQNTLLRQEFDEQSIGKLETLLTERQRHIDAIDAIDALDKANAHFHADALPKPLSPTSEKEVGELLKKTRKLDRLNNSLVAEQHSKLKVRIEELQQNKKSLSNYRGLFNLADGAFVDTKR